MARYAETAAGGGGGGGTVTQGPGSGDPTSPWIIQPSDGAAVYVGAKTGQLPAALDGSGFLKVHEQGTALADVTDRAGRAVGIVGQGDGNANAAKAWSAQLSDGAAFYTGAKTGQLPAALDGSGFLKTHEQGVAHVDDNGGSLTVDSAQLPAALDGSGFLKTHEQGTALTDPIDRTARLLGVVSEQRASNLMVTGTAAVNTGVTVTLGVVIGAFHYITSIEIIKLYSVVGVAAGAGVIITSTNLPGNPAWTTEQLASPAGTAVTVLKLVPTTPLKSAVAATATTIVCPAQLQTIWRVNVTYFTGT